MKRLVLAALLALLCAPGAFAQITAIRAGLVVDPETGTAERDQVILIDGETIREIGSDVVVPPAAAVIDLSEQVVLPGLMDAHTHLCAEVHPRWDLGDFWIMALQRRAGYRAILGAKHAREMLEAGFTTVRDLGNAGDYLDMDLEKAIRFGLVPGPSILPAGRIIAPFGGQFWDTPADGDLLHTPEYYFADSRDELRRAIRENIYWGAKVIKIVVDAQQYHYSVGDIRFIIEEAGRAGVKVAAHVQTQRGARAAIEAGVASIEHGWTLTDEDLALAQEKGVVLVGTDFTVSSLMANGMDEAASRRVHARRVERLRRAYEAGVTVVFGTDVMAAVSGESRGETAIGYIDSFVEAGVPPAAILRAMTVDAARLLGVDSERGALKAGQAADLIAVPRNPLDDIQALREVLFVMRGGTVYQHTADADR